MNPSRILVLGSGGREHALAWRLARDVHAPEVLCAPGNDGIARDFPCIALAETDASAAVRLCLERGIQLVVVGPESALAAGVSDALTAAGVPVFGASRAAAQLESSKWFAKQVMREAHVPTARAEMFEQEADALAGLDHFCSPWVIKADGLAAGKGVLVTRDRPAAEAFVRACLGGGCFGSSGRRLVLEEFLDGEEASVIAICDGQRFVLLPAARDHKRALDGDAGANTGGMGAFAPTASVTPAVEREIAEHVVSPVLRALEARGIPYRGALYCGLMLTASGVRVVEFNARFGDPETQVILPLVTGQFACALSRAARGCLDPELIARKDGAALTIALVAEGYPEAGAGGGEIAGLDALHSRESCMVFHAAARRDGGRWSIRGGRAAYVTAFGADVAEARGLAYAAVATLSGSGWRCRSDIGDLALQQGARPGGAGR